MPIEMVIVSLFALLALAFTFAFRDIAREQSEQPQIAPYGQVKRVHVRDKWSGNSHDRRLVRRRIERERKARMGETPKRGARGWSEFGIASEPSSPQ